MMFGTTAGSAGNAGDISPNDAHHKQLLWFTTVLRPRFDGWVMGTVNRLVSNNDDTVAGFLFMACAIDYLAGLWSGQQTEPSTYRGFVDQFFKPSGRYNSNDLYASLRNGLVHNFTIKGSKYILVHNRPTEHLTTKPGTNRAYLDAQIFRDDLVNAKNLFFEGVVKDPAQLQKVVKRYDDVGFLALES